MELSGEQESAGISNIKFRFRFDCPVSAIRNCEKKFAHLISKTKQSFFVLRHGPVVYSIFYTGHVNCTGIRDLNKLSHYVSDLERMIGLGAATDPVIDNITSCQALESNESRFNLLHFCCRVAVLRTDYDPDCRITKVRFNRETFPGGILNTNRGTCLLFASRKCVFVGTKSLHETRLLQEFVRKVYADYVCDGLFAHSYRA